MRISQMAASAASIYLNKATERASKSSEKISSGKRILTAGDDPSGLTKANSMKAMLGQYNVGSENLKSMKSLAEVKDSALENLTDIAQKISEAYVKKEGLIGADADAIDASIAAYTAEAADIVKTTEYNGQKIFSKDPITASSGNGGTFTMAKSDIINAAGDDTALDFTDATKTTESLNAILSERATVGAYENALDARISVNEKMVSNLEDSYSRIMDVDVDKETIEYNKQLILQKAAQSMISQQNSNMSSILNLLG